MKLRTLFIATVTSSLVASCGGSSSSPDATAGPCVQIASEPVLTIVSAKDGVSGVAIDEVSIGDIKVDGYPVLVELMPHLSPTAKVVDGRIQCRLTCAFGETTGQYTATVTANGYRPLSLSITANYSSSVGNCPNTVSGGTRASIALQPA
ncbi:hypothetical protein [Aquabacterium sp.]|uniref:hypothetical protein n=1 Tax=Aquabacterium sp. TaxID=1872578 RepID=UPI002C4EE62E|nr:hypothetical protein [Aquabacterium sp.]HSW04955.1 hypothetical protein [Aquabacterium sp.]